MRCSSGGRSLPILPNQHLEREIQARERRREHYRRAHSRLPKHDEFRIGRLHTNSFGLAAVSNDPEQREASIRDHTPQSIDGLCGGLAVCSDLRLLEPSPGEILDAVTQEERIAQNEDWCRDLNKRKAEWMRSGQTAAGFRCECWRLDCGARIPLSGREWQAVRSQSNRFAVAPEHVADDHEDVIQEHPHFWIVEKRGEAGEVAEHLD